MGRLPSLEAEYRGMLLVFVTTGVERALGAEIAAGVENAAAVETALGDRDGD